MEKTERLTYEGKYCRIVRVPSEKGGTYKAVLYDNGEDKILFKPQAVNHYVRNTNIDLYIDETYKIQDAFELVTYIEGLAFDNIKKAGRKF